ncbi:MAG: hypothetical protein ACJ0NC_05240 [Candidatus Marivariicella sp.]|jgi:hypothetical protein|nr:hypothetical protein [Flavobacteriaceae bacterium]|tara:strand:- start:540 stop:1169 length:630 start_codon:yes stop_codon:yes gene_type:complete
MKNLIILIPILFLNHNLSFAQEDESNFKFFDSSEEIIPLKKSSQTIGKCCQLGKAMSRLTGGMSDVYLVQSELNKDGTYTVFFVSMFSIGFDTELTQFGVENPTAKISSFHLASEEKFNLLRNLMIQGYKEFKAHPIIKKIKYADISEVLEGGQNEGDRLLLRFHNKKIVKYVSFQLFDKNTGNKTSGRPIFSKFIGQLFGSNEIIDTN